MYSFYNPRVSRPRNDLIELPFRAQRGRRSCGLDNKRASLRTYCFAAAFNSSANLAMSLCPVSPRMK